MRLSTTGNSLGLRIGEWVTVKRICVVDYVGGEKQLIFTDSQQTAQVIGSVKRALGTYIPGVSFADWDYDPPRLQVKRYVWLYQVRTTISGAILLVHSDDILEI